VFLLQSRVPSEPKNASGDLYDVFMQLQRNRRQAADMGKTKSQAARVNVARGLCIAAVAIEDLAHRRHGALKTPAMAFMALALCGARRLAVVGPGKALVGCTPADAVAFLALAPTNVARLAIHETVSKAEQRGVIAALCENQCHGFLQALDVPDNMRVNGADAAALLAAMGGLAHLRSLRCVGAGVGTLLASVGGSLRRLALPYCKDAGELDLARLTLLRRVGPVNHLADAVASLDLSGLECLTRIDDCFGANSARLRVVQLPPSVTSIGDDFLHSCRSLAALLDMTHLAHLRHIGSSFAANSSAADVRLPPSVQSIGAGFLYCSSAADVRLPPSVQSIGAGFLYCCTSMAGVLDVSHLALLERVDENFARCSCVTDVRLPPSVTEIGDNFLFDVTCLNGVLDLSQLTVLQSVGSSFARRSTATNVRLPPSLKSIGAHFLRDCAFLTAVLDLSHLVALQQVGNKFTVGSSVADVRLPPGVTSIGGSRDALLLLLR
jgi:hypothetical protein